MLVIPSLIAAVIPVSAYLLLLWHMDKYEREPLKIVIMNFLWGAVGAVLLALIFSSVLSLGISAIIRSPQLQSRIETILTAPFVEEITKGIFLIVMMMLKEFDNITDGLVYGGAIGLGFGMTENFFYFLVGSADPSTFIVLIVIRSAFTVVMHCIATATLGAFLALSKFRRIPMKFVYMAAGFSLAIIFHMIWNASVSFEFTVIPGFLFIVFIAAGFLAVFLISVRNESKIIYEELQEETRIIGIPAGHPMILSSQKRNSGGWMDESVRKKYVKAAIRLAFRKYQFRMSHGIRKSIYQEDIAALRAQLSQYINPLNT